MKIQFHADEYEKSHSKKPRGFGCWAFQIHSIDGHPGEAPIEFAPSSTLSDAKKWMKNRTLQWLDERAQADAAEVDVDILP